MYYMCVRVRTCVHTYLCVCVLGIPKKNVLVILKMRNKGGHHSMAVGLGTSLASLLINLYHITEQNCTRCTRKLIAHLKCAQQPVTVAILLCFCLLQSLHSSYLGQSLSTKQCMVIFGTAGTLSTIVGLYHFPLCDSVNVHNQVKV